MAGSEAPAKDVTCPCKGDSRCYGCCVVVAVVVENAFIYLRWGRMV